MIGGNATALVRRSIAHVLASAVVLRIADSSAHGAERPFAYGPLSDSLVYLLRPREIPWPFEVALQPAQSLTSPQTQAGEPRPAERLARFDLTVFWRGAPDKLRQRSERHTPASRPS
jgi:hypothetical protein